jgi:hypothetical protein
MNKQAQGFTLIELIVVIIMRRTEERERWVVKARFGCGGSSVIVGAKPSWPTQSLPRMVSRDGGIHAMRVAIADIAHDAGVALELDHEGRITIASWTTLWPHLVRFAASSPGHYVAQVRVEPAPFRQWSSTVRASALRGDHRLRRRVHARVAQRRPAFRDERNLVPRRAAPATAYEHHDARALVPIMRGRVRPPVRRARPPPRTVVRTAPVPARTPAVPA